MIEDSEPKSVSHLVNENSESFAAVRGVALCRCGQSQNKPFCDGTHGVAGFSDSKSAERVRDRRDNYEGKAITVHFNGGICAHAAHCVSELPSVFKTDTNPWIDPNGASVDEIVALIKKCPSGALSYSINGKEMQAQDREPKVTVRKNGPYAITGGVGLIGQERGEGASEEHYALCRCGASKNKPFCDGTHSSIDFKDDS